MASLYGYKEGMVVILGVNSLFNTKIYRKCYSFGQQVIFIGNTNEWLIGVSG